MNAPRVALVTGASSGMGREMARKLMADGLKVWVAARSTGKMRDLADAGAHVLALDLTDPASIAAAWATIAETDGGVDVLVNNAGYGSYGAVEDTPMEDARHQFEVNLFGAAELTRLALPAMRTRKAGVIVNISSMGGEIYTPLGAWYHASKHALEAWSDCLRVELAPFGIHVVIVQPGLIETAFGDVLIGPMMERSGDGPYADLAGKVKAATERTYGRGRATPASAVADVVSRAVAARRPRTRYVVGKMARPLMLARKWLGDRIFDRMLHAAS